MRTDYRSAARCFWGMITNREALTYKGMGAAIASLKADLNYHEQDREAVVSSRPLLAAYFRENSAVLLFYKQDARLEAWLNWCASGEGKSPEAYPFAE
jgi:hypothetical protein